MDSETKTEPKKKALMVTTEWRGVFFGYGIPTKERVIELENVQMCIYWPQENHGVMGLANDGPKSGARIGPPAKSMILQGVSGIIEVTEKAEKEWLKQKWN